MVEIGGLGAMADDVVVREVDVIDMLGMLGASARVLIEDEEKVDRHRAEMRGGGGDNLREAEGSVVMIRV